MTVIAVQPFILRDVDLLIGADNYEAHVSSVRFEPSSSTVTWKGLTPAAKFSAQTSAEWTCVLTLAQDWETANSLASYLLANEGESVDVTFRPVSGGPGFDATLILSAPAIGGDVDTIPTSQVTCGVDGVPVPVAAIP